MMSDISISYHNEEIAEKVRAAFNGTPLYCKQSIEYKGSMTNYRKKLGESQCVILVICDNYLKSSECLAELLEVYKNGSFGERVFPVISKDAEIHNPIYHAACIRHLENEISEIEKSLRGLGSSANLKSIHDYLDSHVGWRSDLSNIFSILKDVNTKNLEHIQKDNYKIIVEAVLKRQEKIAPFNTSQKNEKRGKISTEKIYLCNRKEQFDTFLNSLQNQKKINTFYIHGDEMHGHDEMFERLCNHLRGSYRTKERNRKEIRTLNIDFSTISHANFKITLLSKFLDALGVDLHQYTPSNPMLDEQLRTVCKKSNYIKPLKSNDIIAINFRIPGGEWFEGLTNEIEWFINDFCNAESLDNNNTPTFHFFFSVVYSRANWMKQPFRFRKLRRRKEDIIKALHRTLIPDINELTWVKSNDIRDWLSVIGIENPDKRQQLMATKFKADSRQGYYMSNLKSILTSVINDHANNKL